MNSKNAMETPRKGGVQKEGGFSFYQALEKILQGLSARSQSIIRGRFGVSQKHPKTLEEIGGEYGITRERVRQIIRSITKEVQAKKSSVALFQEAKQAIESALVAKGGVMKESVLLETLGDGNDKERGAIRFFLECLPDFTLIKESDEIERSHALISFSVESWQEMKNTVREIFKNEARLLEKEELLVVLGDRHKTHHPVLFHHLDVSKEIQSNVFGKWGLAAWSDVTPKGTKEKAYLVLKMLKKPLHFREITLLIDKHGLQRESKKTHPQTVHNELIKDKRFVLVGRGTYALAEWGYRRGTVRDVLRSILEEHGQPMQREHIVARVLEVRQVKKSTIVINLNTFFTRIGKDTYAVKKGDASRK